MLPIRTFVDCPCAEGFECHYSNGVITMKPLSLLNWFGGKFYLLDKILPFPKHSCYAELFGGGGSVLINKERARMEVYNDINHALVNFWRVFRDYYFLFKVGNFAMYNSKSIFSYLLEEKHPDIVPEPVALMIDGLIHRGIARPDAKEKISEALRFWYLNQLSFSGNNNDFHGVEDGFTGKFAVVIERKMENVPFRDILTSIFEQVKKSDLKAAATITNAVHERIKSVNFVSRDYKKLLRVLDKRGSLFYLDPPYVGVGKKYEKISENNVAWTDDSFVEMASCLKDLKNAKFILSINDPSFFTDPSWNVEEIEAVSWFSNKLDKAIKKEYIVRNFDNKASPKMVGNASLFDFAVPVKV